MTLLETMRREQEMLNPKELRGALAETTLQDSLQRWRTVPLAERDKSMDRSFGQGMLDRLDGLRHQILGDVNQAEKDLMPALDEFYTNRDDDGKTDRVREIIERLRAEPPKKAGDELEEGQDYLYVTTTTRLQADPNDPEATEMTLYKVNDKTIQADISLLQSMQDHFPAGTSAGRALATLIEHLRAYRYLDAGLAVMQKGQEMLGGRTGMDIGGKLMGRTLIVGALAAAAVVFGSMSLVEFFRTGKFSMVPVFYGLAAWFLADPDLAEKFFDGDDGIKQDFREARLVTRSETLTRLAKDHDMAGPGWAKVIEGIYEDKHGSVALSPTPPAAEIDEAVKELAGKDTVTANRLRAMFAPPTGVQTKNDFQLLVEALNGAKTDGGKELVVASVQNGFYRAQALDGGARAQIEQTIALKNARVI